jgi:hypothetical protein
MISITLPSIHPGRLARTIENIEATTRGPWEAIVVSPFRPVDHPNVKWICELETEPLGANSAHAVAVYSAVGDYLVAWVDDHLFVDRWDESALEEFRCLRNSRIFALGLRNAKHIGTVFGKYYPYFPMMERMQVSEVGGWLSGDYRIGFADCDLAMRIYKAGGTCRPMGRKIIIMHKDDERKLTEMDPGDGRSTAADTALFIKRWAPTYGKGWDTSYLRGFNIDVQSEAMAKLISRQRGGFYPPGVTI